MVAFVERGECLALELVARVEAVQRVGLLLNVPEGERLAGGEVGVSAPDVLRVHPRRLVNSLYRLGYLLPFLVALNAPVYASDGDGEHEFRGALRQQPLQPDVNARGLVHAPVRARLVPALHVVMHDAVQVGFVVVCDFAPVGYGDRLLFQAAYHVACRHIAVEDVL